MMLVRINCENKHLCSDYLCGQDFISSTLYMDDLLFDNSVTLPLFNNITSFFSFQNC